MTSTFDIDIDSSNFDSAEPETLIRCPCCKGIGLQPCADCEGSGKKAIREIGPSMFLVTFCVWCKGEGGHKCGVCLGNKMVTLTRAGLYELYRICAPARTTPTS